MENIKIGADPELFLERDGEIISAEGMIGGTKDIPKAISKAGHAIQEDNVMVEFNIPPSETREDFIFNINFVKSYLDTLAEMKGCKLNFSASAELDPKYLATDQAQHFGCEPDFNVYLRGENTPPCGTGELRSCGGHIHIGYDNPSEEQTIRIAYAMDMVLGLESLALDKDDKRRSMYGKAGSFRFKDYGLEYRTLSNFWIQNDELIGWAYDKTLEALALVESGKIDELIEEYGTVVEAAINKNDKQLALHILENINKKELTTVI
jgi:hypothetical protein